MVSAAGTTTDLGVTLDDYSVGGDVAVGSGKVFVALADRIAVANSRGELTGSITDLPGAVGLATAPDGRRVYAALHDSNEVAEIDAADLTITRRIDLAAYPCPTNLSISGDRLWVGYGCRDQDTGGVLSLDLSTSAPQPTLLTSGRYGAPVIAVAGNTLVFGDSGLSPSDLLVYDVSDTPATFRGEIDGHTYGTSNLQDLAITADGSMVISAFGYPERYEAWDTTNLTKVRTYGEAPFPTFAGYPVGVVISPDGDRIAGGWTAGPERGITLYDAETTTKLYGRDNPIGAVVKGSLAFSGTDVFCVLREYSTNRLYLWRYAGNSPTTSAIALMPPPAGTLWKPLTLTGRLTLADESTPGVQEIEVSRRLPNGTNQPLKDVTTALDGTFTITDTPPVTGDISYDMVWEGLEDVTGSTASVTVTVDKTEATLTLTGPTRATVGEQFQISGSVKIRNLGPFPPARLQLLRTVANNHGTSTTTLYVETALGDGSFSYVDTPTKQGLYTYSVKWPGDDNTKPTQATHVVKVVRGRG
ncbi:hypothetical protein ABZ917_26400 [Nonomuraea wenchangensis]